MKKLTIWMISSSWIVGILIPVAYKMIYGDYPENIHSLGCFPEEYMTKAALIITFSFFISIIMIWILPTQKRPIIGTINASNKYYYFAIVFYLLLAYRAGIFDYGSVITGGTSGAFVSYFSMFFYPITLFVICIFCIKERGSVLILAGSYLIITLLSRSRSGAMHIGILLIGFFIVVDDGVTAELKAQIRNISRKYKRQISGIVIALTILAPIVFVASTNARGSLVSNESQTAIETIAARCSCLDEAGQALYVYETNSKGMNIFKEKYGLLHQIGLIIDGTVPGNFFGGDVDPNQYYRSMVGYMSLQDASKYYSSVNLMLPVYLIMKYGLVFGLILSIFIVVGYFIIISKLRNPTWQIVLVTLVLPDILSFFDWVVIWRSFLKCGLTIVTFQILTKIITLIARRFPKIRFRSKNRKKTVFKFIS